MSNVKLYTEEQLYNTVIAVSNYLDDINLGKAQQNIEKHLKALQPIELPSDDEIEEIGKDVIIYNDTKRGWFIEGLKFMRNKIQGDKQ